MQGASPEKRIGLPLTILVLTLASLFFRFLTYRRFEQTSLLFVGIPALISLMLACVPPCRSLTGTIMKGICLALAMAGIVLGEGLVCILMAAPPALLVGFICGRIGDSAVKRARQEGRYSWDRTRAVLLPLPVLLLMSLEGVSPSLSFQRAEKVTARRLVQATPAQVRAALDRLPDFSRPRPLLLSGGFPQPVSAEGGGITPGKITAIQFAGGEGKPGTLTVRSVPAEGDAARFETVSDTSHIAHWLRWKSSSVTWHEVSPGVCEVAWTVEYDRLLDPAWYFGPAERAAVTWSAEYLIEACATP